MYQSPTIVVFGSTGDLAKKYLWKAISSLTSSEKIIAPNIIGVARRDRSESEFTEIVTEASGIKNWWQAIKYFNGSLNQPELYQKIHKELVQHQASEIIIVLAVAPEHFISAARGLIQSNIINYGRKGGNKIKVLIEKPFGTDLESARKIDKIFCTSFKSEEIYRIDHYLGKSMIQNLYTLRFANPILLASLNNKYVAKIEVNFFETNDVEDRGEFYDQIGAWRDIGQNHILQILAAGMMTKPKSDNYQDFHLSRTKFIKSLKPLNPNKWHKGQYQSYRLTRSVSPLSETETYFELRLESSLANWHGVPIILRGGKSIDTRESAITYYLDSESGHEQSTIKFSASPDETAVIELVGQDDSHGDSLTKHAFKFSYQPIKTDAYERVFYNALSGDSRWFSSSSEILAQWRLSDQIKQLLEDIDLTIYPDSTRPNSYLC